MTSDQTDSINSSNKPPQIPVTAPAPLSQSPPRDSEASLPNSEGGHSLLQGRVIDLTIGDKMMIVQAVEQTFDYRGDVTLQFDDDSTLTGFVFDRKINGPADPGSRPDVILRVVPSDGSPRRNIPLSRLKSIAFTGKDPAAGRSWEHWVRQYAEILKQKSQADQPR